MRHTILIDDNLLEEAPRVLGTHGIRDTVTAALTQSIRRFRLEELRHSLGTVELDLTSDELFRLRGDK